MLLRSEFKKENGGNVNQVELSNPREDSLWRVLFCVEIISRIVERKFKKLDPLSSDEVERACQNADRAKSSYLLEGIKPNARDIDPEMEPGSWRGEAEWRRIYDDLTAKVLGSRQRRLSGPIPEMQRERLKQLADSLHMYEHAAPESGAGGHPNESLEDGDRGSVLDELGRIMEDIKLL